MLKLGESVMSLKTFGFFVLPFCLFSIICLSQCNRQNCFTFNENRKFKHAFSTLGNISIYRCATECFLRSECLSITYEFHKGKCRFHDSDDISSPHRLLADESSVYLGMYAWTMIDALGGCISRPCPVHTRCTQMGNHNFTCVVSECNASKIPKMYTWYIRSVGKTTTLRCKSGYYLNGSSITGTCLPNGKWTNTDEIEAECLPNP